MDLSVVGLKNQLYSEQEQDIIRRSRQACTKKIEGLRDEIFQLKAQIRQLNIALAPHNKLPPEVLQRIFELCCEEPAQIPALPRRHVGIYAISHVCSLWRQIALSTPEFWANVSIRLKPSNKQLQIVEQWFSRAGNHARSLICMDSDHTELHLSLPHTQVMPLKKLLKGPFSDYLEILCIGCSLTMWEKRWPNLFAPTTRLTKLIHIRVSESARWNVLENFTIVIPWNQLQYLDLESWIPCSHFLDILSECASLIRCHMHVDDPDFLTAARRPVTLPALRVLQLFFRPAIVKKDGSHVEETIQFLSVPRLSHLTLGQPTSSFHPYSDNPAICELLQRSNGMPDLVSLDLGVRSHSSPPIDVRALLTNTPRLRLLHVRYGIFDKEVRNAIATGTLVPQLSSIKTEVRHRAIDILRMVELRHQNASMTPGQITEFSSVSFSCYKHKLDSKKHSVFSERLASIKKAAPRLSINLSFDCYDD